MYTVDARYQHVRISPVVCSLDRSDSTASIESGHERTCREQERVSHMIQQEHKGAQHALYDAAISSHAWSSRE